MRHSWYDPSRNSAKMAVGLCFNPGGFDGAQLVRPAVIELDNGRLVEVPLVLMDTTSDLVQLMVESEKAFEKVKAAQLLLPPPRKKPGPRRKNK